MSCKIKLRNKTKSDVWFRVYYPGDLPGLFDLQESVVPSTYTQVFIKLPKVRRRSPTPKEEEEEEEEGDTEEYLLLPLSLSLSLSILIRLDSPQRHHKYEMNRLYTDRSGWRKDGMDAVGR